MAWIHQFRSGGRGALLAGVLLAVVSCGGGPPPTPEPPPPPPDRIVDGQVDAGASLNPDPAGSPSPVVVRIYYLRDARAFEQAEFFPLYETEADVLGPSLIQSMELFIQPDEYQEFKAKLDPEARYFGAMVAFREIDNARWRAIMKLPEAIPPVDSEPMDLRIPLRIDLGPTAVWMSIRN